MATMGKKIAGYIDCTPTWPEALKVCLHLFENGDAVGRTTAIAELNKMANVAQAYVDLTKEDEGKPPIERFRAFVENALQKISEIDKATKWQHTEHMWWLWMMRIQRKLTDIKKELWP